MKRSSSLPLLLIFCLSWGTPAWSQAPYELYSITTLAGLAGTSGSSNGSGSAARFNGPEGIAVDGFGNVYVADTANHTIRKITAAGATVTLAGLAGTPGSINGTASGARFNRPKGVAVDSSGNVYVADTTNHLIRKITSTGAVTTLAGSAGTPGSGNGTGTAATFRSPEGVAVDSTGTVYVADTANHTIRKITPAGVVTTLAGLAGSSGATDGSGSAARFNAPEGVAVDSAQNVYVADRQNNRIRKITPAAVVTTFYSPSVGFEYNPSIPPLSSVAVDGASNLYVAGPTLLKISPAGVARSIAGNPDGGNADGSAGAVGFSVSSLPQGIATDSSGNVYVADTGNHTIRAGQRINSSAPLTLTPCRPLPSTSCDLPAAIGSSNSFAAPPAKFYSVPPASSIAVAFDISHPAPGEFLKVIIYRGVPQPITSRAFPTALRFTLFNRERLVNSAGQAVTRFQSTVLLPATVDGQPFLGGDTYTVQVFNDTYTGATTNTGTFNSCSLIINPSSPNHTSPPSISLINVANGQPLPSQINLNYGDTLALQASAQANAAYRVDRLGITVSPSPTPSPSPSPQPLPLVYRSDVHAQDPSSSSGPSFTYTLPVLPPGLYQLVANALDNAGFAQSSTTLLTVNRLLGIFNVAVLSRTQNTNSTVDFTAALTLRNMTQNPSGMLRVRLLSTPVPAFRDESGPPNMSGFPITELATYSLNPLAPGGVTQLSVSGRVNAPVNTPLGSASFINFDIFAVVEELNQGQWLAIDSLEVVKGVHARPQDFGGPGGGVNDPGGSLGGTAFDPFTLDHLTLNGPSTVTATAQYGAAATYKNSTSAITQTLVPDAHLQWSVSDPSAGTINNNGAFTATPGPSAKQILIQAAFTFGSTTRSASLPVTIPAAPPVLFANISTRGFVSTGDNIMIGGFIIQGPAGSTKKVLIRGIGPSLATGPSHVPDPLPDPVLELHAGDGSVVINDNWKDATNVGEIPVDFSPASDAESVIVATLPIGAHTVFLRGAGETTGPGLIEVYDLSPGPDVLLVNISTRGFVSTGDNIMIGGFIIQGPAGSTKRVLIRGIGPSLATGSSNVPNPLPDPVLELHAGDGSVVINDNWRDAPYAGAIPDDFKPSSDAESVIIATLPTGGHTVFLKGAGQTTGPGLIEVYKFD